MTDPEPRPAARGVRVLIVGSGPAGYTAAVYAARAMLEPVLIQGIQPGGQLTITTEVENWIGDETVMGPDLMVRMEAHARATGAEVVSDVVTSVDLSRRPFRAETDAGATYLADALILATGAQAKWLGLPSEERFKGHGVSACATCDGFFCRNQEVVVIGGGNTAVEEALYLANLATKVTLVHRRDSLRAEKILQDRLFRHSKIEVVWNHALAEVTGTEMPLGVTGVRLRDVRTGAVSERAASGVFVAIGHAPASGLIEGPARDPSRRLRGHRARHHAHLHPRRVRGRGSDRPRLPPGRHQRGDGLHGRARRRAVPGRGRGRGGD